MQLYAFNLKGELINARHGFKKTDYLCTECNQPVRLRGGPHRQSHFFHLEPTPFCRQHQKGAIHLQLQQFIFDELPLNDSKLEYRFPTIGRIADVAWISEKIVFEIQYSPISAEEVLQRNSDYEMAGWTVVWIFHDDRYNQQRLSAAESALIHSPHFFSNMDRYGQGVIYDQFDLWEKGVRRGRQLQLPIDISFVRRNKFDPSSFPLNRLQQRAKYWSIGFKGDLMDLFLEDNQNEYFKKGITLEKKFSKIEDSTIGWIKKRALHLYKTLFNHFLEKACR
jgi:competence protein CoiA